jgi:hypothetical protein
VGRCVSDECRLTVVICAVMQSQRRIYPCNKSCNKLTEMASGEECDVSLQESGKYDEHCEFFILDVMCLSLRVYCNVFKIIFCNFTCV